MKNNPLIFTLLLLSFLNVLVLCDNSTTNATPISATTGQAITSAQAQTNSAPVTSGQSVTSAQAQTAPTPVTTAQPVTSAQAQTTPVATGSTGSTPSSGTTGSNSNSTDNTTNNIVYATPLPAFYEVPNTNYLTVPVSYIPILLSYVCNQYNGCSYDATLGCVCSSSHQSRDTNTQPSLPCKCAWLQVNGNNVCPMGCCPMP